MMGAVAPRPIRIRLDGRMSSKPTTAQPDDLRQEFRTPAGGPLHWPGTPSIRGEEHNGPTDWHHHVRRRSPRTSYQEEDRRAAWSLVLPDPERRARAPRGTDVVVAE